MKQLLYVLLGLSFGFFAMQAGAQVVEPSQPQVELAACEADWLALIHTDEGRGALVLRLIRLRMELGKLKIEEHLPAPLQGLEKKRVLMREAEELENLLLQYQQAPPAK